MDNYREEIVVKQRRGFNNAVHAILSVFMFIFAVMAAMAFSSITMSDNLVGSIISIVVFGGLAFLIFWKKDLLRLEYEYTFTNGELDFAYVIGNKKRKNLGSMRVKNVEAAGLVSSGSFHRYVSTQGLKKSNWFLNRDANLFYFYYQKDGKKNMIIIEPSDELIAMIKIYLSRSVYQEN